LLSRPDDNAILLMIQFCLNRKISATADEASKGGSGGGGASGAGGKSGGGPGKAAMPGPTNLAAFRATLWTHLDQVRISSADPDSNIFLFRIRIRTFFFYPGS
jgi:hypothetical protein